MKTLILTGEKKVLGFLAKHPIAKIHVDENGNVVVLSDSEKIRTSILRDMGAVPPEELVVPEVSRERDDRGQTVSSRHLWVQQKPMDSKFLLAVLIWITEAGKKYGGYTPSLPYSRIIEE